MYYNYVTKTNKSFINNKTHAKSDIADVLEYRLDILHNEILRVHLNLVHTLPQRETRADMLV